MTSIRKKMALGVFLFCLIAESFGANIKQSAALEDGKSDRYIECAGINNLNNKYTPPELYEGVRKCVSQKKYEKAVFLFSLAGIYGHFDTHRVADETAHQALSLLIMSGFRNRFSQEQEEAWHKVFTRVTSHPDELAVLRQKIALIGKPDYYPDYMIRHGMRSLLKEESNALAPNFDADATWNQLLKNYFTVP